MAATIRLMKFGKRGYATYRIVVLEKRSKRDGQYIEKIGTYNPQTTPSTIQINEERFEYWKNNGAILSEGMLKLLKYRKKQTPAAKS